MLSWLRRFRPSPPGLVPLSVGLRRFSFFLPFQGLPVPGQVCCVGVLSVPLLLRPLFAFWLSKFHFVFIVISLSFSFHLPCCGGACVCTICIDVKLLYSAGGQQPIFLCCPTKLQKMWWMGSWTLEPVPAIYIYR